MKPKSTYRALPRISFHAPLKISLALSLMLGFANAAIIASYIDGVTTTGGNLAAPVAGITVSNLTSTGITFTTATSISRTITVTETVTTPAGPTAGSAVGSLWLDARANAVAVTPVSTSDYYSFTLTASSGNLPGLSSLTFDIVTAAANSNGAIDTTYQLFVSADGGAFTAVGLAGTANNPNTLDLFPGDQFSSVGSVLTASIDLTGLAPANSFQFRIALGDNSTSATKTTWMQGIQVDAIPEPGAALLGGLGMLLLLLRRR